ncbi:hypothetical protein [Candidatus Spongiihabitans sp.]|uniref:hypothetical protein n=1 Tax=Candidatus Spongiihabitans sp. TaxID=3101308 RepID=UPI003C7B16B7
MLISASIATYLFRINNAKPATHILAGALFYFVKGVVLLPFAIFLPGQRWRGVKSFINAAAYPMSLFGPGRYEPYREMDGY